MVIVQRSLEMIEATYALQQRFHLDQLGLKAITSVLGGATRTSGQNFLRTRLRKMAFQESEGVVDEEKND